MKLLLTRSYKPVSFLIRAFTWSRFSHVAILHGNTVIDATLSKGVSQWALKDFLKQHRLVVEVEMQGDSAKALELLNSKYDFSALFGIAFKRKWNSENKWFCSELAAYCSDIFRAERKGRITPEHIFMVSKGYKIIKGK